MNWTERKKKFGHQFEVERRGERDRRIEKIKMCTCEETQRERKIEEERREKERREKERREKERREKERREKERREKERREKEIIDEGEENTERGINRGKES